MYRRCENEMEGVGVRVLVILPDRLMISYINEKRLETSFAMTKIEQQSQ